MLERYYVRPDTVDHVRSSWIGGPIERYVEWLDQNGYGSRTILRRIPLLMEFGEVARKQGATELEELPRYIEGFVGHWLEKHGQGCKTEKARRKVKEEARNPVVQMLALAIPDFEGKGRASRPFCNLAPEFFGYLRDERGIKASTLANYENSLRAFEKYLRAIGLRDLRALSPVIISGFIASSSGLCKTSLGTRCTALRVFLRYLYRERIVQSDLSCTVESPRDYRLSTIPRSITWDEVNRMLEAVDRRTPIGKRDYAILLLLVTYGLRAREVAALTLDDIDWRRERLRVPERKAGHSTAYPLSPIVGRSYPGLPSTRQAQDF